MRSVVPLALMLVACTSPAEAEDYALEDAPEQEWRLGSVVPDGEREVVRASADPIVEEAPVVEVERGGAPRLRVSFDPESCWPQFAVRGFPAIDLETGTVVVPLAQTMQLSTLPGSFDLLWLDSETGEEIERARLLDAYPDAATGDEVDCRRVAPRVRQAVRDANRELRSHAWVTMARLPVELFDGDPDTLAADLEGVPVRHRPVQVVAQHGEAIVRIAGVRVLERDELPFGSTMVHRVYAHRESGTVLFGVRDCAGDSCTCDPLGQAAVLRWRPETFAAIDAHPCVPDEPALDDEQDSCDLRALPFEATDELWTL